MKAASCRRLCSSARTDGSGVLGCGICQRATCSRDSAEMRGSPPDRKARRCSSPAALTSGAASSTLVRGRFDPRALRGAQMEPQAARCSRGLQIHCGEDLLLTPARRSLKRAQLQSASTFWSRVAAFALTGHRRGGTIDDKSAAEASRPTCIDRADLATARTARGNSRERVDTTKGDPRGESPFTGFVPSAGFSAVALPTG